MDVFSANQRPQRELSGVLNEPYGPENGLKDVSKTQQFGVDKVLSQPKTTSSVLDDLDAMSVLKDEVDERRQDMRVNPLDDIGGFPGLQVGRFFSLFIFWFT